MSGIFADVLQRLRVAVLTRVRGRGLGAEETLVRKADLSDLLGEFDRVDGAYRALVDDLHAKDAAFTKACADLGAIHALLGIQGAYAGVDPLLKTIIAMAAKAAADRPDCLGRSPKDYAIEHAEYMARSAEFVSAGFDQYGLALLAVEQGDEDTDELLEAVDQARADLQEALVSLRSYVYEFRKRRDRAAAEDGKTVSDGNRHEASSSTHADHVPGTTKMVELAAQPVADERDTLLAEARVVLTECLNYGELDAELSWKAERASKGRRIYTDDRAALCPAEQRWLVVPEECPHMIVFDDTDRPNEHFCGAGARPAALRRYEQISHNWNAHLFVRVEKNSRDDTYLCAMFASAQPQGGDA